MTGAYATNVTYKVYEKYLLSGHFYQLYIVLVLQYCS